MKTLNLKNYTVKPVTGASNGYPVPELGAAILFDTIEELLDFTGESENTSYPDVFSWKDGWHFCNYIGQESLSDRKSNIINYYGETKWMMYDMAEWDKEKFIKDELESYGSKDDYDDEEWEGILENINEKADNIEDESCGDVVGIHCANGTIQGFGVMSIHEDNNNEQLGVFLSHEKWNIDWEKDVAILKED